jgi:hypothetical protein
MSSSVVVESGKATEITVDGLTRLFAVMEDLLWPL